MEAGVHEGWCGGIWESLAGTERQVVVDMAVVVLGFPSLVLTPAVSYLWRKGVYLGSWFGASQRKAGGAPSVLLSREAAAWQWQSEPGSREAGPNAGFCHQPSRKKWLLRASKCPPWSRGLPKACLLYVPCTGSVHPLSVIDLCWSSVVRMP